MRLAGYGRSVFALDVPNTDKPDWHRLPTTVIRIGPNGKVTRRQVRFGYFTYFLGAAAAGPFGFYVGTGLVRRLMPSLAHTPDELFRFDSRLGIPVRAYVPSGVSMLAARGQLWASSIVWTGKVNGRVVRLDPRTLKVLAASPRLPVPSEENGGPWLSAPGLGLGSLWVFTSSKVLHEIDVFRLDPKTLAVRSTTKIPADSRLVESLRHPVGDAHHVDLVGSAVLSVDSRGRPLGRPTFVSDESSFQAFRDGLIGIANRALVLLDWRGRVRARTAVPGYGGESQSLTVSGDDAWFLGNVGQGNGIVHVRLNPAA